MDFFLGLWQDCIIVNWGEQGEVHVEVDLERFRAEHERRTGFQESNPPAFQHHLRAYFGPLCGECGKPLRTPRASKCMECGAPRPA
jgi:hypothetical protein